MERNAEPEDGGGSAPSSYRRDIKEASRSLREALRTDLPAAHAGLGVTVVALIVAASSTAWFVLALAVIRLGGGRADWI
ncbi:MULTISPECIES: hypothetical protein [unclassified Streptomyces]|uniref:hypothetical protein n=1 Tax=unclassified Streptomyces TaxID=2593676 RepID=UPI002E27C8E5|nr:hypothetical protein [Streptomyces sp. NBC_01439]